MIAETFVSVNAYVFFMFNSSANLNSNMPKLRATGKKKKAEDEKEG